MKIRRNSQEGVKRGKGRREARQTRKEKDKENKKQRKRKPRESVRERKERMGRNKRKIGRGKGMYRKRENGKDFFKGEVRNDARHSGHREKKKREGKTGKQE
ncbi:hypothetical protein Tco_0120879 [Tanacetum coccineum]